METCLNIGAASGGNGIDAVAPHLPGISWVDWFPPLASAASAITPRLFTATLRIDAVDGELMMFHASHAASPEAVRAALVSRMDFGQAYAANVREGVDAASQIARHLVGAGLLEALATLGDLCGFRRPLSTGGVLHVVEYASRGGEGRAASGASWRDGAFGRSS